MIAKWKVTAGTKGIECFLPREPLLICSVLFLAVSWGGCNFAGIRESQPANVLACRLSCYGAYQDTAWSHLPSIGIRHVFINVPEPEEVEQTIQRLAMQGLKAVVVRGHADLSRATCVEELAGQLKICGEMGVKYMFLSARRQGADKQTVYDSLRQAGEIAKNYGVTIALETHPDLGTNGDVQLETMRKVHHPNIRVNFDTGNIHFYNNDTDACTELKKIIDYVATVELKDHNGQYQQWNFPPLGKGVVDFKGVISILKKHGYRGPMSMEIEGVRGIERTQEQIMNDIADSAKYIRSLCSFE